MGSPAAPSGLNYQMGVVTAHVIPKGSHGSSGPTDLTMAALKATLSANRMWPAASVVAGISKRQSGIDEQAGKFQPLHGKVA